MPTYPTSTVRTPIAAIGSSSYLQTCPLTQNFPINLSIPPFSSFPSPSNPPHFLPSTLLILHGLSNNHPHGSKSATPSSVPSFLSEYIHIRSFILPKLLNRRGRLNGLRGWRLLVRKDRSTGEIVLSRESYTGSPLNGMLTLKKVMLQLQVLELLRFINSATATNSTPHNIQEP